MKSDRVDPLSKSFDADRPIERRDQDRLGMRSFAEGIAKQIRAVPTEHGFTIAVIGEWGSGKTSVLNMVAESIDDNDDSTAVLHFNPWLFGDASDLMARFFGELSAQLDVDLDQRLKKVAQGLARIGQALAPLSPVPGTVATAEQVAKLADDWAKRPSLLQERDQLRKALTESHSRIVVLIDDIDRLESRETRELVRVVRLISELPNLVFLLAFDGHRVAKSLGENEEEGQQYLDKIVQMNYGLPVVRNAIVHSLFLAWLEELITGRDVAQLDQEAWTRVFRELIKPLLSNLRDAKRYLYALPVCLDVVGDEVALADLLGLEAIRVLRPPMFKDLRAHAECLAHADSQSSPVELLEVRNERIRTELSQMLERAEGERTLLKAVLEILFPATQEVLSNSSYGPGWDKTWRKERRVACGDVFRIYLEGGLGEAALSSREVQQLVNALTDGRELTRLLDSLDEKHFEGALERLEDFEHEFPKEAVETAVPVLVNRLDRLSGHSAGILDVSPRLKVERVVYRLLRVVEDPEALAPVMDGVLDNVKALSGWLCLIEKVGYRKSVGHKFVSEDRASILEGQLVHRLEAATAEQLADEWDLTRLVLQPLSWLTDDDRVRFASRLREYLDQDDFVFTLLRTAVSYAHSDKGSEKHLPWDALIEVFGDEITGAVDRLSRSQAYQDAADEDQDTVRLAQEYTSGWRPKAWNEF